MTDLTAGLDFDLSDRERIKQARRLALDAIKGSIRDSRLRKAVETLDGIPVQTLSQGFYQAALMKLAEIATADEVEVTTIKRGKVIKTKEPNARQMRAIEVLLQHRIAEGELLLEAQRVAHEIAAGGGENTATTGNKTGIVTATGRPVVLAPRSMRRLEEIHRAAADAAQKVTP
jgi:hypothetical protein